MGITAKKESTMIVYRFERNGIGPYVTPDARVTSNMLFYYNRLSKHKAKKTRIFREQNVSYNFDGWQKAHGNKSMIFGCPSKEALRAYFAYSFQPLFKQGFRIKKYQVPDDEVIMLGVECAFPVKYHKFRTSKKLKLVMNQIKNPSR